MQAHILKLEKHFSAGPRNAVLAFMLLHRAGARHGCPLAMLPRDVALHIVREYVWVSRFDALWSRACEAANVARKQDRRANTNKKLHRKKEKKPGTGIKVRARMRHREVRWSLTSVFRAL